MAPVYTRVLGAHRGTSAGTVLLGVCPTGVTWVVRDIVGYNSDAQEALMQVFLQAGSAAFQLMSVPVPTLRTVHLDLRQAMNPDETLNVYCDKAAWQVTVTGYELSRSPAAPSARGGTFLTFAAPS